MKLVAACAFGLESLVKRELTTLGYQPEVIEPGRIAFEGDWQAVCRTNIHLRVADRVLIEVQRFDAPDFDALFETVREFDWSTHLPAGAAFPVTGRSRNSQLTSVPAIQRTVKRALVDSLKKHHGVDELPESGPEYRIDIAVVRDVAAVTIDTTGPSLHKRGYRKLVGVAPLKETLAAALVDLSVWNPQRPLIDPFCGSGTIVIEAARKGMNVAPGVHREFSSGNWPAIDRELWLETRKAARQAERPEIELQISAFDHDEEALELARKHAAAAGVEKQIHFQQREFEDLRSKREYGCVITNPPYGDRLSDRRSLRPLYESIPGVLQRLPTWSHFFITSVTGFERTLGRTATRRRKLFNGRIECTYFQFLGPRPERPKDQPDEKEIESGDSAVAESTNEISAPENGATETKGRPADSGSATADADVRDSGKKTSAAAATAQPVFGGLEAVDYHQAGLFATRLKKRARHLRRWPTKRGITCFRLYERDIPELPFVVDRYDDHLHITEYERPHERTPARHAQWNELMVATAAKTLDVPIQKTFFKSRLKQKGRRGKAQYAKVDGQRRMTTVTEDGLSFLVNLSDYVDTGLFLDHRITRSMVRKEADGQHFLNLFAYTGSFSVYAAAGGATSTTTVDWSNTYIEWAGQNMAANGFHGAEHRYYAEDASGFIKGVAAKKPQRKFGLAVIDPPTFSNSKRTNEDWDVQRCHAKMLREIVPCLAEGAVVYFSNNFRRFKLDPSLETLYSIREISNQTVPEDFRNKRIHRCWRMVLK